MRRQCGYKKIGNQEYCRSLKLFKLANEAEITEENSVAHFGARMRAFLLRSRLVPCYSVREHAKPSDFHEFPLARIESRIACLAAKSFICTDHHMSSCGDI